MSKFKVWIDSPIVNSNVKDVDDFNDADSSKTQRVGGFQAGTPISSQYVNSALRQSTLVTSALMDLTGDTSLDYTSTTDAVKNKLQSYLEEKITGSSVYSSTYAQYSSSDTSKGTIEERLTNLGFKQGNIVNSSGDVVGTVTRQGNYVIAKITKNISVASNTFVYFNITSSSSEYGKEVFLPQRNKLLFNLSLTGGAIWWLAVYNNNAKGSMATYHTQGNYLTILENENTFGWEVPPIE